MDLRAKVFDACTFTSTHLGKHFLKLRCIFSVHMRQIRTIRVGYVIGLVVAVEMGTDETTLDDRNLLLEYACAHV